MKKQLLTLLVAVLAVAGSAMALDLQKAPFKAHKATQPTTSGTMMHAPTADGFDIDFCGDINTWYCQGTTNLTYKCYIYITPEVATSLAGNQLTELTISFASNSASAKRNGSIFVCEEDIDSDPVTSTDIIVKDMYSNGTLTCTYPFETPYTIKEGTGFYMGYIVKTCKYSNSGVCDYPIPVCTACNEFAGHVKCYTSAGVLKYDLDMAETFGGNLFLIGKTVGEKKGPENVFSVDGVTLGNVSLPVVPNVDNAVAYAIISNFGSNDLTSIEYTATCGDNTMTKTAEINVPANSKTAVELPLPPLAQGHGNVSVSVSAVNGIATSASATMPYLGIQGAGYDRKFVVEEGTGTWCGWCPRGIVGFETMENLYPENFIGIAAHSDDAMESTTYKAVINKYFSGFPSCIINRDPAYNTDPSPDVLQECYALWADQRAPVNVRIETDMPVGNTINVRAYTTFDFDDANANYSLAFAVLENDITGKQTNYYSGGSRGEMGGWEKKGSTVTWKYRHVARDIYSAFGLSQSIPAAVSCGVENCYEYEVSLAHVSKIANSAIVVMVLDNASGTILNATRIEAENYGVSGISAFDIDNENAPVEYYNLQGVRMQGTNLPAGIYITRQGQKTSKTVIR